MPKQLVNESMSIAKYLKTSSNPSIVDRMYRSQPVMEFIGEHVDTIFPAKPGKRGLWIFGNQALPVIVQQVREASLVLKKPNGKAWEELYNRSPVFDDPGTNTLLILPNELANIYDLEHSSIFVNLFAFLFIKSGQKVGADEFVNQLLASNSSSIESWVRNKDKLKSVDLDLDLAGSSSGQAFDRSNKPGSAGEIFIDLGNGWKWVDLDRSYCELEGQAAGHCGNANYQSGDNILSLRDAQNRIHMTVVVDSGGYTTEMKAPGNRKPKSYTHPYVVELLLNDNIKGVGQGRFLPEKDFKITDLNFELASKLAKAGKIGKYNSVIECALKANGNQQLFANLIKDSYNLADFDFGFDYDRQAILLDSAPIEVFMDEYALLISRSNNYDSWLDVVEPRNLREMLDIRPKLHETIKYFAAAWDSLPKQFKLGIWSLMASDPLPDSYKQGGYGMQVAERLYEIATGVKEGKRVAKPDTNLAEGMRRVASQSMKQTQLHIFNDENSSSSYYNDGYFVVLDSEDSLSLYISPQGADKQLQSQGNIELPDELTIEMPYTSDVGLDQFISALRQDQFWARRLFTTDNLTWSQELGKDADLEARQQANRERQQQLYRSGNHPLQIQVRNEQEILPNLERRYMEGGLQEYIQQLRQLGWWDDYVKWATQNNRFLPVESL